MTTLLWNTALIWLLCLALGCLYAEIPLERERIDDR